MSWGCIFSKDDGGLRISSDPPPQEGPQEAAGGGHPPRLGTGPGDYQAREENIQDELECSKFQV